MASVSAEDQNGVLRGTRETPPAHLVLKLEYFSLFSANGVDQIKSNKFQAGDHQWKIILFTNGNRDGKGDHVSVYLMLDSTSSLPAGKGVNATFEFFLFDQIRGNYLTVQGRARRFDRLKYEWGFDKFISLESLKEPTKGFLVNDISYFGVEVFVSQGSSLGECHSLSAVDNISGKYKWVITQFSKLGVECFSDEFFVGGFKWKIALDPEGNGKHKGSSLSIFLVSVDSRSSMTEHKVKAKFKLTLYDQFIKNHRHWTTTHWFGATTRSWGWASFIELQEFKDNKKGYLVADKCIIKAEVTVLCEGVFKETRDRPPSHYVLKLESFSLFSQSGVDHIKSNSFQVGDHKWKIKLFPEGNNGGKDDHVSIYLILDSTGTLMPGKGVDAIFKFFLLDQIRGKYLTFQGKPSRFDSLKCEWGFDKFISLEEFEEPTNGYLVNDTSIFGVEVYVSAGGSSRLGESHSISKVGNISGKYKWVITKFSELGLHRDSDEFVVGGYKWKLSLHPEGEGKHKGFSLSMYLVYVDSESSNTEHKVKAEFVLALNDQFKQNLIQKRTTNWFGASTKSWGWHSFIELTDLKDDKNGYVVADQCTIEAEVKETRDRPPSHYVLKLESFSLFSANGVDHINSNSFQVGDHKWKIKLFPKGNNEGKDDHVSIYLLLDSTSTLPAGKGVNAFFKFFLFDQMRGNYLVVQGKASRFDSFKCEWGLDKFISLEDFEEPTNGYLVNDISFFGVELFICEGLPLGECHSISKVANISGKHKWVVTQFSGLKELLHYSDEFVIGGFKWKLSLYPEGNGKYKGHSLSIYLECVDSKNSTTEHEVKAEFEITLNDQFKQNNIKRKGTNWFGASGHSWGWHSFIKLTDLKDDKKGYSVADQCIIEAEVKVLCEGSRKTLKC
ncbi:hypothetical protein ACET3Z_012551 [Daucus carota]